MALFLVGFAGTARGDTTFISAGAAWKYLDNGSDQGAAWRDPAFNDSTWKQGPAELGYGDGDEATVLSYGSNSSAKYITTYFRHTFNVEDPASFESLIIRLVRDDGAIVYLNGTEIARSNMPAGAVGFTTPASTAVDSVNESTFFQSTAAATALRTGSNVLAVELHQVNATSSDISFNLALVGVTKIPSVTVIPAGDTWKYLDNGSEQGTAWRAPTFDDSGWASGPAELGYGDGGEQTLISYGPSSTAKYTTTYFRRVFSVADPSAFAALKLRLMRDDGAIIYLNGVEIHRSNMPSGAVNSTTFASTAVSGVDETTFFETILSNSLVAGANVLAVEVHQSDLTSTDVSFDLELLGLLEAPPVTVIRGPYLQNATSSSMVIRWRTDVPSTSKVWFGTTAANLTESEEETVSTTEHEVQVTGLLPNTQYFYAVGSDYGMIASGSEYTFFTPPVPGTVQPIRVWVLGDSGTANANAAAVRDAYQAFAGSLYTDLWLMLGDNAYDNGTDSEFQAAVFNMYPRMLRQSPLWSALGNHEYHTQQAAPYFNVFTFPTAGEAGGVPSGTEKYYSFDYGNVHFICLDSMSSDRSATGPMATWLTADLESTAQKWIIAFWHHPPYTKGSHDSDNSTGADIELKEMRENFLPLLEAGGVDLVLGGHSHSYERSYFINGHYGLSQTFSESMKKASGSGQEINGVGAYTKPGGLAANQGAVYAVAGNSGKATNWWGGSTAVVNPNPHPAMVTSLLKIGSLVLDINGDRLDAKFLTAAGTVDDQFTILKSVQNTPPTVAVTGPLNGSSVEAPVTVTADATPGPETEGGSVTRVDFYAGDQLIGSDTTAPFEIIWNNAAAGTYTLTATAVDELGASTTSAPVNVTVTVNAPPAVTITSPLTNSSYVSPATIDISATATDSDGTVTKVTFYANSTSIGEVTRLPEEDANAPYLFTWSGVLAGMYQITAVATDNKGTTKTSSAVTVNVIAPNVAPTVSLTSPSQGATYAAPATVALAANASDSDGSIAKVEFYAGATLLASDATAPYSYSWGNVPAGSYTITAVATDNSGASTTSASVGIVVNPAPVLAAPTNLAAKSVNKSRVDLSWSDNSGNETGFYIERSQGGGAWGRIGTVGANVKTYRDTTVSSNTAYSYRVQAYNGSGTSNYSNTLTVTTSR